MIKNIQYIIYKFRYYIMYALDKFYNLAILSPSNVDQFFWISSSILLNKLILRSYSRNREGHQGPASDHQAVSQEIRKSTGVSQGHPGPVHWYNFIRPRLQFKIHTIFYWALLRIFPILYYVRNRPKLGGLECWLQSNSKFNRSVN